jgi:hypothetical protein
MSNISTEVFITKAFKVHKNKYNYDKADYTGCKDKVTITCSIHGDFLQQPRIHLMGSDCLECAKESRVNKATKTTKNFVEESKGLHGDSYEYNRTKYIGALKRLIVSCKEHGDFYIRPSDHLAGGGCKKCQVELRTGNIKDFIKKAKKLHGDRYDYSKSVYVKSHQSLTVTCKVHGDFNTTPSKHLVGYNCKKCAFLIMGHSRTDFKNMCIKNNEGLGTLYIIKCFNDFEKLYKVGITSVEVKNRFKGKSGMPYNYKVIKELKLEPNLVYDAENHILRDLAKCSYKPKISFGGETECFSELEPILDCLEKYLKHLQIINGYQIND